MVLVTIERQPEGVELGNTHASRVIPVVSCSEGALGMVTRALVPLNVSALPNLPAAVQVAAVIVPLLLLPEESATVVPLPSLNAYAATSPAGAFRVVTLATPEYALRLPAASVARTR